MTWRIVNDSLIIGRYKAAAGLPKTTNAKRKIAVFDFVRREFGIWLGGLRQCADGL
jgi:hypothetical protein